MIETIVCIVIFQKLCFRPEWPGFRPSSSSFSLNTSLYADMLYFSFINNVINDIGKRHCFLGGDYGTCGGVPGAICGKVDIDDLPIKSEVIVET